MKKKILIGSIIAVALLTLVSFSSVVGYQSVKSDIKTNSPLFSVRNSKGDVSSNYLGKEDEIDILLPKRNDEVVLIERFINIIQKMDEDTFGNFLNKYINHVKQNDEINNAGINEEELEEIISLIRITSKEELILNIDELGIKQPMFTFNTPLCMAFPVLMWSIVFILLILFSPILLIYFFLVTIGVIP